MQRTWYHGICSEAEIDRILNVQNGEDYILKLRADTIADNIRLWRVYRHIAENGVKAGLWKVFQCILLHRCSQCHAKGQAGDLQASSFWLAYFK